MRLLSEAELLADHFPSSAVALAWSAVEDELMSAVLRTAVSPDYPPHNSALKNASFLQAAGLLDETAVGITEQMRRLRNIVVHRGDERMVTFDEAIEFIFLSRWLVIHVGRIGHGDD